MISRNKSKLGPTADNTGLTNITLLTSPYEINPTSSRVSRRPSTRLVIVFAYRIIWKLPRVLPACRFFDELCHLVLRSKRTNLAPRDPRIEE